MLFLLRNCQKPSSRERYRQHSIMIANSYRRGSPTSRFGILEAKQAQVHGIKNQSRKEAIPEEIQSLLVSTWMVLALATRGYWQFQVTVQHMRYFGWRGQRKAHSCKFLSLGFELPKFSVQKALRLTTHSHVNTKTTSFHVC